MTEPGSELAVIGTWPAVTSAGADATRNPYWTYLARLNSDESRRTMQGCLNRLAAILTPSIAGQPDCGQAFPWHNLRREHTLMIRAALTRQGRSASHINKHLCALRGVLEEAWLLSLMTAEDYHRARKIDQVPGHREPAGRSIAPNETQAMLVACLATPGALGIRDAAIVATLHSTGGRRAEVTRLRIERYDRGERSVSIIGKGNKERTGYIHPGAVPYIDQWLAQVGGRRGPIFRPVDRWGNIAPRPLSPRTVGYIVNRRRLEAKLPPLSTHDWRRTFVGDLLDAGADLALVQQLAGHASPVTTAQYDRRPGRQRRAAVDHLSLPSPDQVRPSGVPDD